MSLSDHAEGQGWPRAVIFDLDGTLVDSAPDLAAALNEVLDRRDLPPFTLQDVKTMIGDGIPALMAKALEAHGVEPDEMGPLVMSLVDVYTERATVLTRLYDGVEDVLIRLRDEGVKIALCTNKAQEITDIIMRDLRLADYFSFISGSREGGPRKPDPAALQAVLGELKVEAHEAVMVGDGGADAAAARAAGMPLVMASFGYSFIPVEAFGPDAVIANFSELPDALQTIATRLSAPE